MVIEYDSRGMHKHNTWCHNMVMFASSVISSFFFFSPFVVCLLNFYVRVLVMYAKKKEWKKKKCCNSFVHETKSVHYLVERLILCDLNGVTKWPIIMCNFIWTDRILPLKWKWTVQFNNKCTRCIETIQN